MNIFFCDRESKDVAKLASDDSEFVTKMMEPFKSGFDDIQQGKNPTSIVNKIIEPFKSQIDEIQSNKSNLFVNKLLKQGLQDTEYLSKFMQPIKDGFNQGKTNDKENTTKINQEGNVDIKNDNNLKEEPFKDGIKKEGKT